MKDEFDYERECISEMDTRQAQQCVCHLYFFCPTSFCIICCNETKASHKMFLKIKPKRQFQILFDKFRQQSESLHLLICLYNLHVTLVITQQILKFFKNTNTNIYNLLNLKFWLKINIDPE